MSDVKTYREPRRELTEDKRAYADRVRFEQQGNSSMGRDFREILLHGKYGKDSRWQDSIQEGSIPQGPRKKAIISGSGVELWSYQRPLRIGKQAKVIDPETGEILNGGRTVEVELDADGNVVKKDRRREHKKRSGQRSKMNLRRLVRSNFTNNDKFLTLTFKDGSVSDVTDVKECNKAFNNFCKRLARAYPDVKYCRVIEFQDSNGRGAVHYHVILTLPYVPYEKLGELWGNGFIGINAIDHVDNVGAYIQKYMVKDFDDPRLSGKKAFATSQNVTRPITVYGNEAEEIHQKFLAERDPVFANSYDSEWNGKIQYQEYNLDRTGSIGRNPFRRD